MKKTDCVKLFLLYLFPVLITVGLRIKTDFINDGTLGLFMVRYYLTQIAADVGLGYYLSRISSKFFNPVTILCSFVFWFIAYVNTVCVVLTNYLPNNSIFISVFDSNWNEISEFLKIVPAGVYFLSVFYWGIYAFFIKTLKKIPLAKEDYVIYGFLSVFFIFYTYFSQIENSFFSSFANALNAYSSVKKEISDLSKTEKTASFHLQNAENPRTVIVVIGESANLRVFNENIADFKEKTDFLKTKPSFIDTAEASFVVTPLVIKEILFPQKISLISTYRKAGFKTFWFSNQYKSSKFDDIVYALTKKIDDRRYFNFAQISPSFEYISSTYDDILLKPLETALEDPAEKKLIFLHLFGSHFPYDSRYPKATEKLYENQYVTSIRYTNTVLAQILRLTEKEQPPAALIYFSDHGTIPTNPFERPKNNPEMVKTPMFFWFSEKYLSLNENVYKKIDCLKKINKVTTQDIPVFINELAKMDIENLSSEKDIARCLKE